MMKVEFDRGTLIVNGYQDKLENFEHLNLMRERSIGEPQRWHIAILSITSSVTSLNIKTKLESILN